MARIGASNDTQVWRTQLVDASAHPSDWSYPGVVGVHQNGYVYVVYETKLSKLDPDTGDVVATANLPYLGDKGSTAYNGFNGFSDRMIVAKTSIARPGAASRDSARSRAVPTPATCPIR